jgi:nicotinate-nucleotide--dimethylbenzimidazole phosphoribosyltransferase
MAPDNQLPSFAFASGVFGARGQFQVPPIPALDLDAQADCQRRLNSLTKPAGSLGMLEELALRLSAIRGFPPKAEQIEVLVFAADHGVAEEGVSAFPKAVTAQMVTNFATGGAAINVFTRQCNGTVTVVDVGVDAEFQPQAGLIIDKVCRGTANLTHEDAMSATDCHRAMAIGARHCAARIDAGADVVCFGEMGIANTTAAAALICALLPMAPQDCVGRGTGVDDATHVRKIAVVEQALARVRVKNNSSAFEILAALGGLEIAAIAGGMLQAALRKTPVLVDGFIASSAALCAIRMAPGVALYLIFSHRSAERGHARLLEGLGQRALLQLDLRLGEGTGAVLAVPLLRAACAMVREMATFESAGVSEKKSPI